MSNEAASPNVEITIAGTKVADSNFLSYTVDRDMFQPDMCSVVLSNQGDGYSKTKVGDAIEIKVGDSETSIYKGEVIAVEPTFKGGEKTRILIRAMNKFHRLLRKRKSMTYQDKTDQQILSQVAQDAGLSLEWKHDVSITYKHVYQHNQTNMEFLRTRAARAGCHVWCVDTTLFCKQPDLQSGPIAELKIDESSADDTVRSFQPRVNSSAVVKKVTVKGWDPENKKLVTGEATAQASSLGDKNASSGSGDLGGEETFQADTPITMGKEEADMLAKAKLQDVSLGYMTGTIEVNGNPNFDLGKVVKITANAESGSDTFNGKYYIMGITHRHVASKTTDGGYTTVLRLARDAQGSG